MSTELLSRPKEVIFDSEIPPFFGANKPKISFSGDRTPQCTSGQRIEEISYAKAMRDEPCGRPLYGLNDEQLGTVALLCYHCDSPPMKGADVPSSH